MDLTFNEYLQLRQNQDECGDPIGEEAWCDFADAQLEVPDVRGVLKGWIRDIWSRGYKRGFKAGFAARGTEDK